MRRVLLVFLILLSCAPYEYADTTTDPKLQAKVLYETLEYWDTIVGYRNEFSIKFVDDQGVQKLGHCRLRDDYPTVIIYTDRIARQATLHGWSYGDVLRAVLLHEIAHAHLSCTDRDHVDDKDSILYPRTDNRIYIDEATLHRLWNAEPSP